MTTRALQSISAAIPAVERHMRRLFVQVKASGPVRDFRRETDNEIRAAVRGLLTSNATD